MDATGHCNEMINITVEAVKTYFVGVEYHSKDSVQNTIFAYNSCRPANRRTVGAAIVQCTTSGQPDSQRFNATVMWDITVNRETDGAVLTVTSARATTHVNISLDSGKCPSVAKVSSVRSGFDDHSVTLEVEQPNCSGWRNVMSYRFSIECQTNCKSEYEDSGSSSTPMWVFPHVSTGVYSVTVTAENSCGEQTVLAWKQIPVGSKEEGKEEGSVRCDTVCIVVVAVACLLVLLMCSAGVIVGVATCRRMWRSQA